MIMLNFDDDHDGDKDCRGNDYQKEEDEEDLLFLDCLHIFIMMMMMMMMIMIIMMMMIMMIYKKDLLLWDILTPILALSYVDTPFGQIWYIFHLQLHF